MFRISRIQSLLPALFFFFVLQQLYSLLSGWIPADDSWSQLTRLMVDRLLYALILPGLGFWIYTRGLPYFQILQVTDTATLRPRVLRTLLPHNKILSSLGAGLLVGVILYGVVFFGHQLYELLPLPSPPRESVQPTVEKALKSEEGFLWILLFTGLLTPLLEELYYRTILQGSLLSMESSIFWALLFQALCFGLAHDFYVAPLLGIVGLVLGTLYWRNGVVSSWTAHATYNILILLQARWGG